MSCLHKACIKGNKDIAALLLDKGADPNKKDNKGMSPFQYAVKYNNKQVIALLKSAKITDRKYKVQISDNLIAGKSAKNELIVAHTGNSGWLIKYKDQILIFDYYEVSNFSSDPALANGVITPELLKGKNVKVFVSHGDADHFSSKITDWEKVNPQIEYYFGFDPNSRDNRQEVFPLPKYTRLASDSCYTIGNIKIALFKSPVDTGSGFIVRLDDLTILHTGDAVYQDNDWPNPYSRILEKYSREFSKVDLAFLPVTSCGFHNEDALNKSIETVMDLFKPVHVFPMHGYNNEERYYRFRDGYSQKYKDCIYHIADNPGDYFLIKK
jgi:glyoxylase-like metal-dependent hydrolase (beta-lactamase superfamily II)